MSEISRRVDSMMSTPFGKWPEPCYKYLQHLSSQMGFCGEIAVTACYHYLQSEVGLECHDDLYEVDTTALAWFENYRKSQCKSHGCSPVTML